MNLETNTNKQGVPKASLFSPPDLHSGKNMALVIQNIYALSRIASTIPDYKGPLLEERKKMITRSKTEENLSSKVSEKPKFQKAQTVLNTNFKSSAPELQYIQNASNFNRSSGSNADTQGEIQLLKKKIQFLENELKEERERSDEEISSLRRTNAKLREDLEEEMKRQSEEFAIYQRKIALAEEKNRVVKRGSIDRSPPVCTKCEERDKTHSLLLESVYGTALEMPILISHLHRSETLKPKQLDDFLALLTKCNVTNRTQLLTLVNSSPPSAWSSFCQSLETSTRKQLEQMIRNEPTKIVEKKPKTTSRYKKSVFWIGACILAVAIASATYFYRKKL